MMDRKLLNQMYSDPITVDDGKCKLKGIENNFLAYLCSNHTVRDHFEGNKVTKHESTRRVGISCLVQNNMKQQPQNKNVD